MKFEPTYVRGASTQHFGKRGLSWHGFLVFTYVYDSTQEKAVRCIHYVDQIVAGSNKQDGGAVLSMIEAALQAVKREFPFVSTISFQSDNAKCYHSKLFSMLSPGIARKAGFNLVRILHTETADGKCLIDAHFATGGEFVRSYIIERKDAATPLQVFEALGSNGGLNNSIVQLVRINRVRLKELEEEYAVLIDTVGKMWKRSNDVFFKDFQHEFEPTNTARYVVDSWQYSDTGTPDAFKINLAEKTCAQDKQGSKAVDDEPTESWDDLHDDAGQGAEDDEGDIDEDEDDGDDGPHTFTGISVMRETRLSSGDLYKRVGENWEPCRVGAEVTRQTVNAAAFTNGLPAAAETETVAGDEDKDQGPTVAPKPNLDKGGGDKGGGDKVASPALNSNHFLPYERAKSFVHAQGIATRADWALHSRSARPSDIPSNPETQYKPKWQSWRVWLGSLYRKKPDKEQGEEPEVAAAVGGHDAHSRPGTLWSWLDVSSPEPGEPGDPSKSPDPLSPPDGHEDVPTEPATALCYDDFLEEQTADQLRAMCTKDSMAYRGSDGNMLSQRELRAQLSARVAAAKIVGGSFAPAAARSTTRRSVARRSAAAHALSRALHVCSSSAGNWAIMDGSQDMPEYAEAAEHSAPWDELYPPGWAMRRKHGKMYGMSYMDDEMRGFIRDTFMRGKAVSSDKQHPSWILEQLQQLHPMKLTLPSEQEIRNEISRLFARQKKGLPLDGGGGGKRGRATATLAPEYVKALEEELARRIKATEKFPATGKRGPEAFLTAKFSLSAEDLKKITVAAIRRAFAAVKLGDAAPEAAEVAAAEQVLNRGQQRPQVQAAAEQGVQRHQPAPDADQAQGAAGAALRVGAAGHGQDQDLRVPVQHPLPALQGQVPRLDPPALQHHDLHAPVQHPPPALQNPALQVRGAAAAAAEQHQDRQAVLPAAGAARGVEAAAEQDGRPAPAAAEQRQRRQAALPAAGAARGDEAAAEQDGRPAPVAAEQRQDRQDWQVAQLHAEHPAVDPGPWVIPPDADAAILARLDKLFATRNRGKAKVGRYDLTPEHWTRLRGDSTKVIDNYLSDELINAYCGMVSASTLPVNVKIMNTQFYGAFKREGWKKVKTWVKADVQAFDSLDYLVVPIHVNTNHWSVCPHNTALPSSSCRRQTPQRAARRGHGTEFRERTGDTD